MHELVQLLQDSCEKFRDLDQIYVFLEKTLKEQRVQLMQMPQCQGIQVETGMLNMFLRRCEIAFDQMLFEQKSSLFESFACFLDGKPYKYQHSPLQLE